MFQVTPYPVIYIQVPFSVMWAAGLGHVGMREGFLTYPLFLSTCQVTPPTSREQGQRESLHAISKLFRIKVSKKKGQKVSLSFIEPSFHRGGGQITSMILGGVEGAPKLMFGLDENNNVRETSVSAGV